jgi:hypothetical protein
MLLAHRCYFFLPLPFFLHDFQFEGVGIRAGADTQSSGNKICVSSSSKWNELKPELL